MAPGFRRMLQYGRTYYKNHVSFGYLLAVAILLGILLYYNYTGTALARALSSEVAPAWVGRYLLYAVPFFAAYLLQPLFFKQLNYPRKKWFWILLVLAPAIFTFRVQLNLPAIIPAHNDEWTSSIVSPYAAKLFIKSWALVLPAAICWYWMDGNATHRYGLRKTPGLQAYVIPVLLMLPFLWWASFGAAFLQQYPRAFRAISHPDTASLATWLAFEIIYAFDFLSIEFFFRAFLILGFLRFSGVHAIIPAACFYCCIHLDKPLAEAISSFFGGWLLGIICYNSKSIWGGLLIHVGIAWLMELFAWLHQH